MNLDPILNFRTDAKLHSKIKPLEGNLFLKDFRENDFVLDKENYISLSQPTMITETREAIDSSEHA